uniref:LAGLIDADG homing endonuclease n=1 Tax=Romanomermis culicivorax TaxID=13658 RepID=A0A915KAV4_ROMCU
MANSMIGVQGLLERLVLDQKEKDIREYVPGRQNAMTDFLTRKDEPKDAKDKNSPKWKYVFKILFCNLETQINEIESQELVQQFQSIRDEETYYSLFYNFATLWFCSILKRGIINRKKSLGKSFLTMQCGQNFIPKSSFELLLFNIKSHETPLSREISVAESSISGVNVQPRDVRVFLSDSIRNLRTR